MNLPGPTEVEMRNFNPETPKNLDELSEFISDLVIRDHDYGTCVYAMSLAAYASFMFVAHKLGVTGFQASCADLDIVRRTRNLERFMIIDFKQALYPQYNLHASLDKSLSKAREWLIDEAKKCIARLAPDDLVNAEVLGHWKKLAAGDF